MPASITETFHARTGRFVVNAPEVCNSGVHEFRGTASADTYWGSPSAHDLPDAR